jgi:ATP phosphoribosyltransferase
MSEIPDPKLSENPAPEMSHAREPARVDRGVTIAVPKGRVLRSLAARFARAGVDPDVLLSEDRRLVRATADGSVRFLLLKPDDVPTYVEYGAADLGVVGRDVLLEREYDLYVPLDLGIGRCQMAVAGLAGKPPRSDDLRPLRVATKFAKIAERHYQAQKRQVEIIYVQGSVELAPITGLADVIVDLVETGETLRQNGLEVFEHVVDISSVVIANVAAFKLQRESIRRLLAALAE